MPKPSVRAAGGLAAIRYALRKGRESGGLMQLYRRMRSRNACKSCAYGMGGQAGGMVNEIGAFPELCKKSIQVQVGDMQKPIDEDFFRDRSIDELERWSSMQLEQAGRLAFPIACEEGDTHFRRVSWDDALDRLAAELTGTPRENTFFYASGRSSNEAAFLLQVLARAYGTNNIHNCSCYCHRASGVALSRMLGSGTATVTLDDLDHTDLAIVAGANPASNHPRLIAKFVELRQRGGTVIVVNPLLELGLLRTRIPSRPRSLLFGSEVSDIYLQPHIGSDIAVFKALLKGVVEHDGLDSVFLNDHTEGWTAVRDDVQSADWDELLALTGLSRSEVDRTVDALVGARNGIALWAMGLTHHEHGVDNIVALANLAAARGWIGGCGRGLMPIQGHSNGQGVDSVGFTPSLKQAFADKMEEVYGIPAAAAGLDTYGSMEAAAAGMIRAAVLLGGNLYASNPDREWAGAALRKIGTIAHIATKLNQGHVHGRGRYNMVLPVLVRDEESQSTTQESMFNFVRLSDGGFFSPPGEIKSEVELICTLAARLLPQGPFPFEKMTSHQSIREAIAAVVPGFSAIGEIGASKAEFRVADRVFHEPRFNTPSGKLRLEVPQTSSMSVGKDRFRMMTVRSEGQFNSVVYEDEDLLRGNTRRDVVMMSPEDGASMGLGEYDPVTVENETGSMKAVVSFVDIPDGNVAMYYPEANVLVPRRLDPRSGTPAFKSVPVRISH